MAKEITGILKKWQFMLFFAILAIIFALTAVFFSRKPVILVSDKGFNVIYGEKRGEFSRFILSLRIFRPIKTIAMASGAGTDLVVQGAISLSLRPYAVFFPYRYREAAMQYSKSQYSVPVVILAGRKPPEFQVSEPQLTGLQPRENIEKAEEGKLLWVSTGTETDLYRAGVFAGVFARFYAQNRQNAEEDGAKFDQKIALFHETLKNQEKTAFIAGLEDQQCIGFPLFISDLGLDLIEENLACAVVLDEFHFSEEGNTASLILFSWMDPVLAPRRTLVIFDDSPWAQIGPVLGLIKKAETGFSLPSKIIVGNEDKTLKTVYNEINKLKTVKKP
jgi:hypothetical protein